jgi:mannose-6-phosphate isomerase-like protein (cupin superfamily)
MQRHEFEFGPGFRVVLGNGRSQAAEMVLRDGETTGGPENRHEGSDQWLYVTAGSGVAVIDGDEHQLEPGTLILIERGEVHEIRNTGAGHLETINFYVPPAYD